MAMVIGWRDEIHFLAFAPSTTVGCFVTAPMRRRPKHSAMATSCGSIFGSSEAGSISCRAILATRLLRLYDRCDGKPAANASSVTVASSRTRSHRVERRRSDRSAGICDQTIAQGARSRDRSASCRRNFLRRSTFPRVPEASLVLHHQQLLSRRTPCCAPGGAAWRNGFFKWIKQRLRSSSSRRRRRGEVRRSAIAARLRPRHACEERASDGLDASLYACVTDPLGDDSSVQTMPIHQARAGDVNSAPLAGANNQPIDGDFQPDSVGRGEQPGTAGPYYSDRRR